MSQDVLRYALEGDPSDWLARLALADELEAEGEISCSRRERCEAWQWAFAECEGARWRLLGVTGKGRAPKEALFYDHGFGGEDVPTLLVAWRADRYDTPEDPTYEFTSGAYGSDAELIDSRGLLPDAPVGSTLLHFARCVDAAGGWWHAPRQSGED